MAYTANDLLQNADLFRSVYPHWPHAEPPLAEAAIAPGEDRPCAECLELLPAGAPAMVRGDTTLCVLCAGKEA